MRVLLGKVMLENDSGEKYYIPVKDLSEHDKKHLSSIFVPKLNIRFSDSSRSKFRSKNALADDIIRIVDGTATVEAKDKIPSETLRMEVYMIGEEVATDDYKLLEKGAMPLKLNEENDFTCELKLETQSRKYMEYNYQLRGCLYLGSVVIILDRNDQVVDFRSGIGWIKEEQLDPLRQLDVDDFFDSSLKPRPVPRPKFSTSRVGVQ